MMQYRHRGRRESEREKEMLTDIAWQKAAGAKRHAYEQCLACVVINSIHTCLLIYDDHDIIYLNYVYICTTLIKYYNLM